MGVFDRPGLDLHGVDLKPQTGSQLQVAYD